MASKTPRATGKRKIGRKARRRSVSAARVVPSKGPDPLDGGPMSDAHTSMGPLLGGGGGGGGGGEGGGGGGGGGGVGPRGQIWAIRGKPRLVETLLARCTGRGGMQSPRKKDAPRDGEGSKSK